MTTATAVRKPLLSMSARKRLLRILALTVMTIYSIVTIFPFYARFQYNPG